MKLLVRFALVFVHGVAQGPMALARDVNVNGGRATTEWFRRPETGRIDPHFNFDAPPPGGQPGSGRHPGLNLGGGSPGGGGERNGSPLGGSQPGAPRAGGESNSNSALGPGNQPGPAGRRGGSPYSPGLAGNRSGDGNQRQGGGTSRQEGSQTRGEGHTRRQGPPTEGRGDARERGRQARGDGDAYVGYEADIQGGSDLARRVDEDRLARHIRRVERGFTPFVVRLWDERKQQTPIKPITPQNLRPRNGPFHVLPGESDESALIRSGFNQPLIPFHSDEDYWRYAWGLGHRDPLTSGESRLGFGHAMWYQWDREIEYFGSSRGPISSGTQTIQVEVGPEINQEISVLGNAFNGLNFNVPTISPPNAPQGNYVPNCPSVLGSEFCSTSFTPSDNDRELSAQIKETHTALLNNHPLSPQQKEAQESAFSMLFVSNESLKVREIVESKVFLEFAKLLAEVALGSFFVTGVIQDTSALLHKKNFVDGSRVSDFEQIAAGVSIIIAIFTRGHSYYVRGIAQSIIKGIGKYPSLFRVTQSTIRSSDEILGSLDQAKFTPRQIVDALKEVHIKGLDFILGIPNLTRLQNGDWVSRGGLVYAHSSDPRIINRLVHVLEHTVEWIGRRTHSVFDVPVRDVPALLDDAWIKRTAPNYIQSDGRKVFIIEMNHLEKPIGIYGERHIRIVIENGTENHVVTAHPIFP